MLTFISLSVFVPAILVAMITAIFLIEVVAAVVSPEHNNSVGRAKPRKRVAVVVPAHNEGVGLLPTLADIQTQLSADDRLLVVADNCDDDTADVAAAAGAEVLVRNELDLIGKGYALARGIEHLDKDPPDVVIIIDADCRLDRDTIARLATVCAATRRPVQALDLMIARDGPTNKVAEFAWRVKNWVRPLGLRALGFPCQLMGTGMAFPFDVIRSVNLASGEIVEDLKLGLDLALLGHPAVFCPSARVTSDFPTSAGAILSQRRRWEQGHIELILATVPYYFLVAVSRGNWPLLVVCLDAAVPPLSLLAGMITIIFVLAGLANMAGAPATALWLSGLSLVGMIAGGILAWLRFGRDVISSGAILMTASYLLAKLFLYREILFRKRGSQWIRTDRGKHNK